MQENKIFKIISQMPLFDGLNKQDLHQVAMNCSYHQFLPNQDIIIEGEQTTSLYIIIKGEVDILKYNPIKKNMFVVSNVQAGNYVGEMSFVENAPRSCTVRSTTPCEIIEIPKDLIGQLPHGKALLEKIMFNISNQNSLFNRLRNANTRLVQSLEKENELLQEKKEFAKLFILVLFTLSLATFITRYVIEYVTKTQNIGFLYSHTFIWIYLIVVFIPTFIFILFSNNKFSVFGFNIAYWKKTLIEISAFLVAMIILIYCLSYFKLINFKEISFFNIGFPIYLFHAFIQEFISKGVLQTSLYNFFGYRNPLLAIVISSYLFGMLHIHFGIIPVLITFIFSFILGFIYHAQKNIFGISVIHGVLGWLAFSSKLI